ncbi:MAG: class D sortase [Clostridia bacterium]|nr:class D sortase [Clostridia bacterium]
MIKPITKILYILIITIIILIIFTIKTAWESHSKINLNVSFISSINEEKTNLTNNEKKIDNNWVVKIPEIDLYAQIKEGTTKDVMNKYVGHFDETQLEYGNVGLAAHNRGYPVNYFENLKQLKVGSEIIYIHEDFEMTYVVEKIEVIENTNWEYLQNTEDNRITLITCVENEPKYRRCIQGVEKIESEEY